MTHWTEEMKARAASMKRAGIRNADIAKRLGVTEKAVRGMTHKLGARKRLDGKGGGHHFNGRVTADLIRSENEAWLDDQT